MTDLALQPQKKKQPQIIYLMLTVTNIAGQVAMEPQASQSNSSDYTEDEGS